MNPTAQKYKIHPCIVCEFPFSDLHHIHPEKLGRDLSLAIRFCPNHHRCAHILQNMMNSLATSSEILSFSNQHFDSAFNKKALFPLMSVYDDLYDLMRTNLFKMTEQEAYSLVEKKMLRMRDTLLEIEQHSSVA